MEFDPDNKPAEPPNERESGVVIKKPANFTHVRWDLIVGMGRESDLEHVDPAWIPALSNNQYADYDPALNEQGLHIVEMVGKGKSGVVFIAWDETANDFVALKGIRLGTTPAEYQHCAQSLLWEAEITSGVHHPNILSAHNIIEGERGTYLVMLPEAHLDSEEDGWHVVRNNDLKAEIRRIQMHGSPDLNTLRPILESFVKVCDAVQYLHDRGIVHGDIKPQNVLLDASSEPLLVDFGCARRLDSNGRQLAEHHSCFSGTPGFIAPETVRKGDVSVLDRCSEVYSLGAILYTILSGSAPYQNLDSPEAKLFAAISRDPKPIEELNPEAPAELISICRIAMTREPQDRYREVSFLRNAVQDLLDVTAERVRLAS